MASDAPAPPPVAPQTVSSLWVPKPQPLSAAAGQHRWVWDLRPTPPATPQGGGGGGGFRRQPTLTGTFTVKLTAGGKSYTQPLVVTPDPRSR